MNYFEGIFVVALTSFIACLLGQIPYQFTNQEKVKRLKEGQKKLKLSLNVTKDDKQYEKIQLQIIGISMRINKIIIIPLILQMIIIFYIYGQLGKINPMKLWVLWYLGFAILFGRVMPKLTNALFGVKV